MTDWHTTLTQLRSEFPDLELQPPAPAQAIDAAASRLGGLPDDLAELYRKTNGLSLGWFTIYPVYDDSRIKKTWDSLLRANDPTTAPDGARGWPELAPRFLIFASFAGPGFAAYDREQGRIWFFEDDELHETDLDLPEFIRTIAREVRDFPQGSPVARAALLARSSARRVSTTPGFGPPVGQAPDN